jgi:hypothetical protein
MGILDSVFGHNRPPEEVQVGTAAEEVDHSRRKFVGDMAMGATTLLALGLVPGEGGEDEDQAVSNDDTSLDNDGGKESLVGEEKHPNFEVYFDLLCKKFEILRTEPHRLLSDENIQNTREARMFLSRTTYQFLVEKRIVLPTDFTQEWEYTDPKLNKLWGDKRDNVSGENVDLCREITETIAHLPDDQGKRGMSWFELVRTLHGSCDSVREYYRERNHELEGSPDNEYLYDTIEGSTITALSLYELMPATGWTEGAKEAVYRALKDSTFFHPERMTVARSSRLTLGLSQTLISNYQRLAERDDLVQRLKLSGDINEWLSVNYQAKLTAVLQFENLQDILYAEGESQLRRDAFRNFFKQLDYYQKRELMAMLLGVCHYGPEIAKRAYRGLFEGDSLAESDYDALVQKFLDNISLIAGRVADDQIGRHYAESMRDFMFYLLP